MMSVNINIQTEVVMAHGISDPRNNMHWQNKKIVKFNFILPVVVFATNLFTNHCTELRSTKLHPLNSPSFKILLL